MQKLSNSELRLRKPISTLVMIPTIRRLTPTGRKIFNYLFHKAQNTVSDLEKEGNFLRGSFLFSTPLKELADFLSENRSDDNDAGTRSLMLKHLNDLQETHVEWSAPEAKNGVIWDKANLLSQVRYEIKDNENLIRWNFPPCIIEELENPGKYTQIQISQIAKLRLYQSICLYEICNRYKNNFAGKTCNNSPQWWTDALSCMPKSEYAKPKIWRQIKASVNDSILEINELTDITISMKEFKTGKKVTGIQFTVLIKDDELVKEINVEHVAALNQAARLGVNVDAALTNFKSNEVEFALSKLEGQMNKGTIDNPQAYLNKILRDLPSSVIKTLPAKIKTEAPNLTSQDVQSAPVSSISSAIENEFLGLPLAERIRYCELVAVDQKNEAILTKRMKEKLLSGDLSELLTTMVCERYALEIHG